jgi:hypothetical protein
MIRHIYKKKITYYEIKGTNKNIVNVFKYPKIIYNKLASYEYDNIIFKTLFYCYDKVNSGYNIVLDEIYLMFSDLFYDVVNEHLEKNANNVNNMHNPRFISFFNKNPEAINNMFLNILDKIPDTYPVQERKVIEKKNTNILNDIKKFNNLDTPKIENKKTDKQNMSDKELDQILDDELENLFNDKEKIKNKELQQILNEQEELNNIQETLRELAVKFNNTQEQIL